MFDSFADARQSSSFVAGSKVVLMSTDTVAVPLVLIFVKVSVNLYIYHI